MQIETSSIGKKNYKDQKEKSCSFIKNVLLNLPNEVIIDILDNSKTILNWGHNLGDSSDEIKMFFDKKKVYELNISENINDITQVFHQELEIILDDEIVKYFDVVFIEFPEYLENLIEILKKQLKNITKYCILLIPFDKSFFNNQKFELLSENILTENLSNFNKIYQEELIVQNENNFKNQLLIIYKNSSIEVLNINCVATWDQVAETYNSKINDIDIELSNYLINFYKINNLIYSNSIIELGCGSGHISLKLKEFGIAKVSLLDFSLVALEKAKQVFDKTQGNFIYGDLLNLQLDDNYDITWNSGVLEHFNDEELLNILKNIYSITNKYFICIVPNPKSLIYLLMRRNRMINDNWHFGIEYLRTNYETFFEKAGFKVKEIDFIGYEFSKYFLREVFMEKYENLGIDDLLINELYLKQNNYLQIFVCEV